MQPHRRLVAVSFIDLRGFTAFTDTAEPEEVMAMLREYHGMAGPLVTAHGGTLEHFAGDGMTIFFNDPVPVDRPVKRAAEMAVRMREAFAPFAQRWAKLGYVLGLGIGIAEGYATLGAIGFAGRWDYAAIGSVSNLAARLCGEARAGQILLDRKTLARIEEEAEAEAVGELTLKGFARAVPAFNLVRLRD